MKCILDTKFQHDGKSEDPIPGLEERVRAGNSSEGTWLAILHLKECRHSSNLCLILMSDDEYQPSERNKTNFPSSCHFISGLMELCKLRTFLSSCSNISYVFKISAAAFGDVRDMNIYSELPFFCNTTNNACDWICINVTNNGEDNVELYSLGTDSLPLGEYIVSAFFFLGCLRFTFIPQTFRLLI